VATVGQFQGNLSEQSAVCELRSVARVLEDACTTKETQRLIVIAAIHAFACLLRLLDCSFVQAFPETQPSRARHGVL
jgi:hypothetical protein